MYVVLLVLLVLLLLGAVPTYPWSRGWGWYPAGGVGTLLVVVLLILLLTGRL
jgi:hypothetical protein